MDPSADERFAKAEDAICAALADLLNEKPLDAITMSDIARRAGISRSTLYAHHGNVMEAYRAVVVRFYEQSQTLDEHFSCGAFRDGHPVRPFCECLRDAAQYKGVVADGRFLTTALAAESTPTHVEMLERLQGAGLPADVASAIVLYTLSGCYAVATSELGKRSDWPRIQQAMDRFVKGGMNALGLDL